jgi:hypothetical protein
MTHMIGKNIKAISQLFILLSRLAQNLSLFSGGFPTSGNDGLEYQTLQRSSV